MTHRVALYNDIEWRVEPGFGYTDTGEVIEIDDNYITYVDVPMSPDRDMDSCLALRKGQYTIRKHQTNQVMEKTNVGKILARG